MLFSKARQPGTKETGLSMDAFKSDPASGLILVLRRTSFLYIAGRGEKNISMHYFLSVSMVAAKVASEAHTCKYLAAGQSIAGQV